jgi:hypothetical protein
VKKIELHLHLEGAAPAAFIRSLAAEKHADLSGVFDERGDYAYDGFDGFLRCYEAASSVLQTPRDYARLLAEVLERSAEQGVVYTELFVSPEFCGGGDLSAWRDYLAAMAEVAEKARGEGIDSRAILTAIRHFGPDRARKTAICAAETAGAWVTGFGMGGAEAVGRATDYAWSFDCAREAGLGPTASATPWHLAVAESDTASAPSRIRPLSAIWPNPASRWRFAPDRMWRLAFIPIGLPIPLPGWPTQACALPCPPTTRRSSTRPCVMNTTGLPMPSVGAIRSSRRSTVGPPMPHSATRRPATGF